MDPGHKARDDSAGSSEPERSQTLAPAIQSSTRKTTSVARGVVLLRLVAFAARAPHGTAQEFRLLVRLLKAIPPAPGVVAALGGWFLRAIRCLRAAFVVPSVALLRALTAIAAVVAIIEALAIAALVAAERPVMPVVVVVPVVTFLPAFVAIVFVTYRLLHLRHERRWEGVFVGVAAVVITEFVGPVTHLARCANPLAIAVHALALLIELLAIGHDDAAIMLGVLQIVFCKYRIARRLGVARQGHILFSYMSRRAPNFHVRAIGFEAAGERIVVVTAAALAVVVVPPTSAAILLSLPHCPNGSRFT